MDYNDLNEEDSLLEQEQENKGQQTDLFDVASNVNDINNRIQRSKMPKDNAELGANASDLAPKAAEVGGNAGGTAATNVANAGTSATNAGTTATTTANAGVNAAKAANTVNAATTAATTSSTVVAGTSVATAGTAAVAATPVGWIILGVVLLIILIVIIVVLIQGGGSAFSEGTGSDEGLIIGTCDTTLPEAEYNECKEIYDYTMGDAADLGNSELYNKMLNYCAENQTFLHKIGDFFTKLVTGNSMIDNPCALANAIEKVLLDKETEVKLLTGEEIRLSRGLMVGTLQLLYDSYSDVENVKDEEAENIDKNVNESSNETNETNDTESSNVKDENKTVDSSSPNSVLYNIIKSGMVSISDIRALADYMVFTADYTSYEWKAFPSYEGDCIEYNDKNECIKKQIIIPYGCEAENFKKAYVNSTKYQMFLRFGGYYNEVMNAGTNVTKALWSKPWVLDGFIFILDSDHQKIFEPVANMITLIKDLITFLDPNATDPATSFQEITNYNDAYEMTSDECKIEGLAKDSLPESTKEIKYILLEETVEDSLFANQFEPIDTTGYDIDPENVTLPQEAVVLHNCKLNNLKRGVDTNLCTLEKKELNYLDGFMYWNYPEFHYNDYKNEIKREDYTDEKYIILGKAIEGNMPRIDEYEEHLNEIFGFDKLSYDETGTTTGIQTGSGIVAGSGTSNSCLEDENMQFKLVTCANSSESTKRKNAQQFPGGYVKDGNTYVSKDTISFEQYVKGVATAETGEYFGKSTIESVKFMIIALTSYMSSSNYEVKDGVKYAKIGSDCAQNYTDPKNNSTRENAVLDEAYEAVKGLMFLDPDGNVAQTEYGAKFTDKLAEFAKQGLTYEQMLDEEYVRTYGKTRSGKKETFYDDVTISSCSTTTEMGYDFVENARKFVGWMNKDFINSEYQNISGFRMDGPWCARFVNLIKELTPDAKAKMGSVSGQAAVASWIRHFASQNGLTLYSSQKYAFAGYWKDGQHYSYNSGNVYTPKPGDLIFYSYKSKGHSWNTNPYSSNGQDHVAIVSKVYKNGSRTCIDTIEGNVGMKGSDGNSVKEYTCAYNTTHVSVAAYGAWE